VGSRSKEDEPVKLTTITQVTVDGVMQGPGANPVRDDVGVFERRGWAHFDDEAGAAMDEVFQRAGAFLFGRKTYEHFAETWGSWDDPGDSPIWTALNTLPKYVVSTSLTGLRWAGATVISDDVATAVRDLKARAGGELQVHGSGALFRWLFENELVDEMTFFTFPVVVGQGTHLFAASGPDVDLALIDLRATRGGVTIQVYEPIGRPRYSTTGHTGSPE
jgi:dihydrofolate reductase